MFSLFSALFRAFPRLSLIALLLVGSMTVSSTLSAADFNICTAIGNETEVAFPNMFCCSCFPAAVQIVPADAGIVTSIDDTGPVDIARITWNKGGVHTIRFLYSCDVLFIPYTEIRERSAHVTINGYNNADFTLSDVNTCPSPLTAFNLIRTSYDFNTVSDYRIEIFQVNNLGTAITGGAAHNSGLIKGNLVNRWLTSSTTGINFQVGQKYRVRVTTTTPCSILAGSPHVQISNIITIKDCKPTANFTINGSAANPMELFDCHQSPMIINNTSTVPSGGTNITQVELSISNATPNCASSTSLETTVLVANSSTFDLRNLFSSFINPGWYRLRMRASNTLGFSTSITRCIRINAVTEANADFRFKGFTTTCDPAQAPINLASPTNYQGAEIGQRSAGILLSNYVTNQTYADAYKVKIYQTDPTTGVQGATLHDSGILSLITGVLPPAYDFNNVLAGPAGSQVYDYFKNLSQSMVINNRYKVVLEVRTPNCGWSSMSSYFRFKVGAPNCKTEGEDLLQETAPELSIETKGNPISNTLFLDLFSSQDTEVSLSIYDLSGRMVLPSNSFALTTGNNLLETDCSQLPSGMYFYVARSSQSQVSGKFVKQ